MKNKVTIYLYKDIGKFDDVLNEKYKKKLKKKEIKKNMYFFYFDIPDREPSWIKNFFIDKIDDLKIISKTASGLLLIKKENNIFAIPFGYGHNFLEKSLAEENFGLKLILNIVDKNSIRKISKKTLSSEPKNTVEQLSRISSIMDFSVDIEQDLIEEITGIPKKDLQENFTDSLVVGKTAFTISKEINVESIEDFLNIVWEYYNKDDYKKDFDFIDNIKELKSFGDLDEKIIKKINNFDNQNNVKLWLAIPEIIKWEEIKGFVYSFDKEKHIFDDVYIEDFVDILRNKKIDLKFLKDKRIIAIKNTNDEEYNRWSLYKTIYAEVSNKDNTYILSNGKWYKINNKFVSKVNEVYEGVLQKTKEKISLPDSDYKREDKYNEKVAENESYILMDKKNISYGGGYSSIELCDLLDKKNKIFIHVKKYSGSSTLSHLFSQAEVSSQLILQDQDFIKKAKEKEPLLNEVFTENFNPNDYSIVFGIIHDKNKKLDIPFFSKVKFKNTLSLLNAFGYKQAYLVKINQN